MFTDQQTRVDFSQRLQELMLERNLSQSDLARAANKHFHGTRHSGGKAVDAEITRGNISSWCNARQFPSPTRMAALARALDVPVEDLAPQRRARPPSMAAMRVTDMGGGLARITVDKEVPWSLATKIIELMGVSNVANDVAGGGHSGAQSEDGAPVDDDRPHRLPTVANR
jgi:transcriptional regulator with XRE-family HTH domain